MVRVREHATHPLSLAVTRRPETAEKSHPGSSTALTHVAGAPPRGVCRLPPAGSSPWSSAPGASRRSTRRPRRRRQPSTRALDPDRRPIDRRPRLRQIEPGLVGSFSGGPVPQR
jgi:hypothetical protein